MKRAGLQNIKRKLFQKDFSKKIKNKKIVENAIIWTIKHIVKINTTSLVVWNIKPPKIWRENDADGIEI